MPLRQLVPDHDTELVDTFHRAGVVGGLVCSSEFGGGIVMFVGKLIAVILLLLVLAISPTHREPEKLNVQQRYIEHVNTYR